MADSFTVNYGWTKPDIGASDDTWGDKWNANLDGIDAQIRAGSDKTGVPEAPDNQTYGRAVGAWNEVVPQSGGTFTGPVGLSAGGAVTGGGLTFVASAGLSLPSPSNLTMGGGSAGWALTTDGAGTLSWSPVATGGPYVPISGATMTGALIMQGSNMIALNSPLASGQSAIIGQKAGINRWQLMIGDYTAEGLNNVGSNFSLVAFSTTGATLGTWLSIARADGSTNLNGAVVNVAGSMSINGVLLVSNVGNLSVPGGAPGQFLQTNGSGVLSWATPAGGGGGGGVPEAPTDSRNYARYNATWNPIVSFPEAPGDGQYYARRQLAWQALPAPAPPVTVSDTAPASPAAGQMWFDSVGGQTYLWYPDPNTSQWVPATNTQGAPGPQGPQGATGPAGATGPQGPTGASIGENRIINGDMRIDQRNSGAAVTPTTAAYTLDRWAYWLTQASKASLQRTAAPATMQGNGFPYVLTHTCLAAVFPPAATDAFYIYQPIEADMISDFAWGTANAQPVTLSFWVFTTNGGTCAGSIRNAGGALATRSYPFNFTMGSGVWQKFTINIPGDTAGTWTQSGNGVGPVLAFAMCVGANFQAPSYNAWAAGNFLSGQNPNNLLGLANATFSITGVKLEIGNVATSYNRQSLAKSLADCQRYYQTGASQMGQWGGGAAQAAYITFALPVTMRAMPTVTPNFTTQVNCSSSAFVPLSSPGMLRHATTVTAVGVYLVYGTFTLDAEL